jgi:hypothetical protein
MPLQLPPRAISRGPRPYTIALCALPLTGVPSSVSTNDPSL